MKVSSSGLNKIWFQQKKNNWKKGSYRLGPNKVAVRSSLGEEYVTQNLALSAVIHSKQKIMLLKFFSVWKTYLWSTFSFQKESILNLSNKGNFVHKEENCNEKNTVTYKRTQWDIYNGNMYTNIYVYDYLHNHKVFKND